MPCAGAVLSDATVAVARVLASVLDGLWHITQYSVLLRRPPWSDRATWQLLQLARATTVRRGCTGEPSTEKLTTGFAAPASMVCAEVVPASKVTLMRVSPPTE